MSPRKTIKADQEVEKFISSPPKVKQNFVSEEYKDYLLGPKINSFSSPKRDTNFQEKEYYKTPERSTMKSTGRDLLSSRKKSPMKGYEEEELVRALKEIINNTKLLENTKNELALRSDFNLFDAFRWFDLEGKGVISFQEFQEGLADLYILPTEETLDLFFRRYDADCDNYLK